MRLLTPLGLIGLIGVLLLALIYILKPKFQEKLISSTFVWKLSLKYKKKKLPFQWLKSSLLVILQFLILGLLAFALATPLIELDTKSGEKIVILDMSANMMAESNGTTRFERAIEEIGAMAESTTPEDRFTVILAGEEASFVARRLDDAKFIKQLLSELDGSFENANMDAAVLLTEGVLAENPYAEIVMFTGNQYSETGNIDVRDMSKDEWNVSILNFEAELEGGYYDFIAEVASYNKESNVVVSLYIDDQIADVITVEDLHNEVVEVAFDDLYVLDYAKAEVVVEYEDSFVYDNNYAIYGWENEMFSVQIVSETPRFLQAVMLTLGNFDIDIPVAPDESTPATILYEGYDLYIFDSVVPELIPDDGSVWLINPPSMPVGQDLDVGVAITGDFDLSKENELLGRESEILSGVTPSGISVSEYSYLTDFDEYTTLLKINDDPVVITKDLDGEKLVVFGFSLHNSNLPIIPDYIILMHNLAGYSVQNMVERNLFYAGEQVDIRKKASSSAITVDNGIEEVTYDTFPVSITADTPGEYHITQELESGEIAQVDFFVRIQENQLNFQHNYGVLNDPIIPASAGTVDAQNDTIDIVYILVGALLLLMVIEWGMHYNEHN